MVQIDGLGFFLSVWAFYNKNIIYNMLLYFSKSKICIFFFPKSIIFGKFFSFSNFQSPFLRIAQYPNRCDGVSFRVILSRNLYEFKFSKSFDSAFEQESFFKKQFFKLQKQKAYSKSWLKKHDLKNLSSHFSRNLL